MLAKAQFRREPAPVPSAGRARHLARNPAQTRAVESRPNEWESPRLPPGEWLPPRFVAYCAWHSRTSGVSGNVQTAEALCPLVSMIRRSSPRFAEKMPEGIRFTLGEMPRCV